jgi:hypothetical protein
VNIWQQRTFIIPVAFLAVFLLACGLVSVGGSPQTLPGPVPTQAPGVAQPTEQAPTYLMCDPQQLPFPLVPGAKNCTHLDIITNFQTTQSPEQVVQFYAENLLKSGWTRKDDGALPGMGSWVKEPKQLNVITVVEKEMTSVQIQEVPAR